jgi:hypothetical protein
MTDRTRTGRRTTTRAAKRRQPAKAASAKVADAASQITHP